MRINETRQKTPPTEVDALGGDVRGTTVLHGDDGVALNGDKLPGTQITRLEIDQRGVIDYQHIISRAHGHERLS